MHMEIANFLYADLLLATHERRCVVLALSPVSLHDCLFAFASFLLSSWADILLLLRSSLPSPAIISRPNANQQSHVFVSVFALCDHAVISCAEQHAGYADLHYVIAGSQPVVAKVINAGDILLGRGGGKSSALTMYSPARPVGEQ
jgi:hypothetical protein